MEVIFTLLEGLFEKYDKLSCGFMHWQYHFQYANIILACHICYSNYIIEIIVDL